MKILKIVTIIFLLGHFSIKARAQQAFEISGHIDGLKDGEIVKLGNRFKDWHKLEYTDSCKAVNGNFHLKGGAVPDGPRFYEVIHFNTDGIRGPNISYWHIFLFIINGQKITLTGNVLEVNGDHNVNDLKIQGSPSTDALAWEQSALRYADSVRSKIAHRLVKIQDSIGYDKNLVQQQLEEKLKLDQKLDSITKNVPGDDRIIIPELDYDFNAYFGGYHGYFLADLYKSLSPANQNSYYGKLMAASAKLAIGQPFPTFTLADSAGKMISLPSIFPKNKITIVDFWATNSIEVDKYQRELKFMYKKYHTKGLDIIGVSADTSVQEWKNFLDDESYPWTNVIANPKGWGEGSLVNDVYNEGGHRMPNTTNVLLDNKGKILAWDVSGVELQYYLDKYLSN